MAGTTVGQLQLDLLLNSAAFQTQLQTAVNNAVSQTSTRMGGTISATFSRLGKIAIAAFSVKAITGFVKEATELGSTLQEVQNVVDVTFTSMSENVNAFASTAIKQFGLSEAVTKKYVGTMGAMAKSFGFTEQEAYNMSTTLTGLVGDVASFYNLDSDVAYTKLKAVFTGETEALKDLGVVMTQSALDQFALAKGYGKTTAKMTEQEKVALRYAFVQEQLSAASGDFLRTQDGWANQMRVLSLQWDSFKANIGQGFIAVLTPLLKSLNVLMEKLVHFSAVFKATVEQIYGKQPESAGSGVAALAGQMAQLENNTESVGNEAQKTAKKLKSLMGFDNLNILADNSNSSSSVSGTSSSFNIPTTEYDTSTNPFTEALTISQEETDKMKSKLSTVLRLVLAIGTGFAGWKIGNVLGDIIGITTGVGGLSTAVGAIVAGIPIALIGIRDAWVNGLDWLNGTLIPLGTTMAGAGVGAIIGSLGGPIGAGLGALAGLCIGLMTDLLLWIKDHWTEISTWLQNTFPGLISGFTTLIDNIKGIFQGLWDMIAGLFTGDWERLWEGVKSVFGNWVKGVGNIFIGWVNGIVDAINIVIRGLNKIKLPDALGGAGVNINTIANVPYLANGGYVKPNTPQLAMIGDNRHQGEIVAPENKLNEAVAANVAPVLSAIQQLMTVLVNGQNSGGDITIPIYLDGSMLDEYIVTAQDRRTLRSGGLA